MIRLMSYLKSSWLSVVLAPLLMVLEVAMDLLQPAFMADIVDIGVAKGDLPFLMATAGKMLLIALIGAVGGVGCTVFASKASMEFGTGLRQDLFDKVQTFSFAELDTLQTSSLITRLTNDVVQVQNMVGMLLRVMVRAPFMCIGGVIMAFVMNARLAMILVVAMPILAAAITILIRKGFPLFRVVQGRIDRVNEVIRENLAGVRVVKAYVRQDRENERFDEANDSLMWANIRAQRVMVLQWPILMLILNLSIVAALWFGGLSAIHGTMETGKIMAFINYIMQILFSLMMVAMILLGASRAKASADRINEVLDTHSTIEDPQMPRPIHGYTVEFRNVSFRYPGAEGQPTLRNINFTAQEGETIGILGATGSGKTTLVSLIPRLYDATEGQVLIGGVDVRDIPLSTLRERIGVVLQESILFSGTIDENLRWGGPDAEEEALKAAAADAQAHEFISKLEHGYKTELGQRGVNLSGGQKQRLAIARALLKNLRILILDDSTSAVDMATEARLQQALRMRMGTCTRFVIAQRISSVLDADKILVIDDGCIAASGKHRELLLTSDIYRDIVRSQLGEEAINHG